MPKQSHAQRQVANAHGFVTRAFNKAVERYAEVPLGHEIVDRRTAAKQDEIPGVGNPLIAMSSGPIQQKNFKKPNHPEPKDSGQSYKAKAAGKVVDPTAIETSQAADGVSVDSSGAGFGSEPATWD